MITEKLIFKIPYDIPDVPDFSTIFGANYYDDWNFNDSGSLVLSGSLIDSVTSSGLNGAVFSSSGALRPSLVTDAIIGKDVAQFDGVSEFMTIPSSTGMYNFLHNGSGGCIIAIHRPLSTPASAALIVNNGGWGVASVGFRHQTNSLLSNNIIVRNSTSIIMLDASTELNILSEYNSNVNIFDVGQAVAADKSTVITNAVTDNNNTSTGTPSVANSTDLMHLGRSSLSPNFYYNMNLARLIIADTIPTPTQLAQIQARLIYDYGTFPIS